MKINTREIQIWHRREYQCVNGHTWNELCIKDDAYIDNCPYCDADVPLCSEDEILDLPFITFEPAAFKEQGSGKIKKENRFIVVISHPTITETYRTRFSYSWQEAVKLADQVRKMPFGKALNFLKAGVGK